MSDENVVSLEDDAPAPEPVVEAPPEPVAAEEAPPAPEEVDPNAVDLKDESRVRGLLAELSRKRGETRDLKAKAERVDQLEAYVNETRPYVEFLKENQDFMKPRQSAQDAKPDTPQTDAKTVELAKMLDLYDANGQPDINRASMFRSLIRADAQQTAQAEVQPYRDANVRTQSIQNFNHALAIKDSAGRSPSREALSHLWRNMPIEKTADPQVAAMLALTALGYDTLNGKLPAPVPQAKPVLETEASGGATRRPAALSDLETNLAKERGIAPGKWSDLTKGHQSGRSSVLED